MRFEIDETIARGSSDARSAESVSGPARLAGAARSRELAWTVLGAALGASLAAGLAWSGVWPRARPPESRPLSVSIVHTEGSEVAAPAISPDGRRVAYRARRGDGMPLLWVRDLASGESQSLPGTEDATMPFWSPDSRDLGFFAGAALKRVSAAGGPVRLVTDNVGPWTGYGGSWAADGTIAFSRQAGLFRVPADGGAMTALTKLPSEDWAHFWPSFLPDGRRFLFTAKLWTRTAEASEQGIYLGSLDSPKIERLLPDLSSAVYASPGYLVFAREGTLAAAPFDLAAGRVTGPPIAIGGAVATDAQFYLAGISASADGTLAVRPPPAVIFPDSNTLNAELRLVDRSGTGSRVGTARLFSSFMALSPMGSRPGHGDPRPTRRHAGPVADGPLERPHRAADDDARVYREPGLVRRRQATGLRLPASWPDRRRVRQGYRHRGDPARHRDAQVASTQSHGPTTVGPCSSSPTMMTRRTCRRGRSRRARSRALSAPGPRKRGVLAPG